MQRSDLNKFDLPDLPGVYLFKKGRQVLYVGKATSLRDRVRSYFDDDLIATRGPRIVDMVTRADRVSHETASTVLEALVREAALIKKYQPKANVEGKDDKTFLYVVITREEWPRVLIVRGKDLGKSDVPLSHTFGPFPNGTQLKEALRLIRKIFPFYDTPKPVTTKSGHLHARIEFNRQIGQYPHLPFEALAKKGALDQKAYRQTIRRVALLLSGRVTELRKALERDMKQAAAEERFEEAAELRRELFALDHVQDVSLIKKEREEERAGFAGARIEAYDTAHLAGRDAIGVMVAVVDGVPEKKAYRTFRIKGVQKNDDIASLREVLVRRLGHPEWPLPNVIVVDGGKAQKKATEAVLAEASLAIPVVAVVKDERHRPREITGARAARASEADIVLANSESHRFSLSQHRKARSRSLKK